MDKAIQSFHNIYTDVLTKFAHKRLSSSEDIAEMVIIIQALNMTLTVKIVKQYFWWTFGLIILYHHSRFGYKKVN